MTSSTQLDTDPRPTIAFASAQLPTYLADEHGVVARSRSALEAQAGALGFTLHDHVPVVTSRAEADAAAAELEAAGPDLVLLQSSSFAMGDVVLPFLNRSYRLGLWAVEEPNREGAIALNNLVSMHLHAGVARLAAPGAPHAVKWFYGTGAHPFFGPRLAVTVSALRAVARLRGARIGLFGGVAPSFLSLGFDPRALRSRLAVDVIEGDLHEIFERARSVPAEAVAAEARLVRGSARDTAITDDDLATSVRVALALRAAARAHGCAALAVSDWPVFQHELGIHPGLAFSWVDERDGTPVAAEGDVLGAATMVLARGLSRDGAGAMLVDVNDVDVSADALLAWHCGGSPLSWADEDGHAWIDHTTLGRKTPGSGPRGAVADLRFRRGGTTVLRLRRDGAELFVVDAEVVHHQATGFSGSRGWLGRFDDAGTSRSAADVLHALLVHGVEHHLVLADGRHGAAAREAATWLGMSLTPIDPYRDELVLPEHGARA